MGLFDRKPRVDKAAEAAAAAAARAAAAAARGPPPFDTFRFNISCKCAKDRMELQKNKALNAIRKSERGVAELLRSDQNALARLQMQSIIREQLGVEALQLAAVYVELLRARSRVVAVSPTLDAAPPDVREAVINAAFADAHMDVKELREAVLALRAHFGTTLDTVLAGPDAPTDSLSRGVDNQLVLKLRAPVADSVLVTGRLVEVAAQYGVEWVPPVDGLHNASVADGGGHPPPPSYGSAPPGAPYGGGGRKPQECRRRWLRRHPCYLTCCAVLSLPSRVRLSRAAPPGRDTQGGHDTTADEPLAAPLPPRVWPHVRPRHPPCAPVGCGRSAVEGVADAARGD